MRYLTLLLLLLCATLVSAQERPQSTRPAETPERQTEIRDSIRARGRVHFDREEREGQIRYEPDRALLMPGMERTAIFRIGIPGWMVRMGVRAGRRDFDSDEDFKATQTILRGVRAIRIAAFVDNGAYDNGRLLEQYMRYSKRRRTEPVMQIRAPEGGVQIHVKQRRGTVRLITLLAYGEEGAAVIRLKSRFKEKHLRKALEYMLESAEEDAGIEINTEVGP